MCSMRNIALDLCPRRSALTGYIGKYIRSASLAPVRSPAALSRHIQQPFSPQPPPRISRPSRTRRAAIARRTTRF